jgi:hypothetical protein
MYSIVYYGPSISLEVTSSSLKVIWESSGTDLLEGGGGGIALLKNTCTITQQIKMKIKDQFFDHKKTSDLPKTIVRGPCTVHCSNYRHMI